MNYLEALSREIRQSVPGDAPPEGDISNLFLIYAVLLLAKGEEVRREDVHNAWVAWMLSNDEQHESMVPFAELPSATQAEDSPFVAAIHTVARRHGQG